VALIDRKGRGAATATGSRGWAVAAGVLGVAGLWLSGWHPAGHYAGQCEHLQFQTRHGERLTEHLADNSVIELNADTTVIVGCVRTERR
jgi:ferric-dicitrate binding protein FerR (iron transport regulator)